MTEVVDEIVSHKQMAIVEKYESVIAYLYPILHSIRRDHAVLRTQVQSCLLDQVRLFIEAGKTNQISRLYQADANLAMLRWYLRFMSDPRRRLITGRQHQVAGTLIAEVGSLLGAWIRSRK